MGPTVILDPGVLAAPETEDSIQAEPLVRRIMEWSRAVREEKWVKVALPSNARTQLYNCGVLPDVPRLKSLLRGSGLLGVYDANTLYGKVQQVLDGTSRIEDLLAVHEVLAEGPTYSPDLADRYPNRRLQENFENILVVAAACCTFDQSTADLLRIGCREVSDDGTDVLVRSTVVVAETSNGRASLPALPWSIENVVRLCSSIAQLVRTLDPLSVWRVASNDRLIHLAISLKVQRLLRQDGKPSDISSVPAFYVGTEFLDSLKANEAIGDGRFAATTLDTCARLILWPQNADLTPFYEGKSRRPRLRSGDGSEALRIHITDAKRGLRLMLWRRPDGAFELANVGNKKELEIANGDPRQAWRGLS